MVNQGNFVDSRSIGELRAELIVEIKITMRNPAVLEVFSNLQVTEEVLSSAVDDRDPLLTQLMLVVVTEN